MNAEPRGGDPSLDPKPVSASRVTLSLLATPESRNLFGNVHGGWILRQVDEAAYVSAARHAGRQAIREFSVRCRSIPPCFTLSGHQFGRHSKEVDG